MKPFTNTHMKQSFKYVLKKTFNTIFSLIQCIERFENEGMSLQEERKTFLQVTKTPETPGQARTDPSKEPVIYSIDSRLTKSEKGV